VDRVGYSNLNASYTLTPVWKDKTVADMYYVLLKTASKRKRRGLSPQRTIPSDRRLSVNLVPNFADRGCRVVSASVPNRRYLDFLDPSRYFFFQVASSVVITRLSGPCSRSNTSQKIWYRRKSNPGPLTYRPQRRSQQQNIKSEIKQM
jgi:hypothetical protein